MTAGPVVDRQAKAVTQPVGRAVDDPVDGDERSFGGLAGRARRDLEGRRQRRTPAMSMAASSTRITRWAKRVSSVPATRTVVPAGWRDDGRVEIQADAARLVLDERAAPASSAPRAVVRVPST